MEAAFLFTTVSHKNDIINNVQMCAPSKKDAMVKYIMDNDDHSVPYGIFLNELINDKEFWSNHQTLYNIIVDISKQFKQMFGGNEDMAVMESIRMLFSFPLLSPDLKVSMHGLIWEGLFKDNLDEIASDLVKRSEINLGTSTLTITELKTKEDIQYVKELEERICHLEARPPELGGPEYEAAKARFENGQLEELRAKNAVLEERVEQLEQLNRQLAENNN